MQEHKGLRRLKHIVLLGAALLSLGCANFGEIANLEEIGKSLSSAGDYHFRKTRWGYSQAMVELSEQKQSTRSFFRKENTMNALRIYLLNSFTVLKKTGSASQAISQRDPS